MATVALLKWEVLERMAATPRSFHQAFKHFLRVKLQSRRHQDWRMAEFSE